MFIPIIMGSHKDLEHARAIAHGLRTFDIASEIRVASAHKAVRHLLDILTEYEASGEVALYITVAGRSNALSGVVDANVKGPVIACPPYSERFGGADLYSSVRMPSGVAPAVVLEPAAAALLAAKILALAHPDLARRIDELHRTVVEQIQTDDAGIRKAPPSRE